MDVTGVGQYSAMHLGGALIEISSQPCNHTTKTDRNCLGMNIRNPLGH
jgi:hypothetical protein